MRIKPISKIIAFAVVTFLAASATPSFAKVIHRHPVAPKVHEDVTFVPLTSIHVLGNRPAPFALDAKAAFMIDADTGAVLYAYNEHDKMQPASLAKIMTFYISLDALKAGKISPSTDVTISDNHAVYGGGVENAANAQLTMTGCTISGNSATVQGGGLNNSSG